MAGRGPQGADRRGPQLRALLPRPRLRSQRQLALCRPGAAAGLSDRRRPPQLLGTDYEANYARLSALADAVLSDVLCYDGAAAGTSYFAISNGRTEASENVWGSALPYLVPVDSSTDLSADNYEVTLTFSAPQVRQLLSSGLGIAADSAAPERWFGETTLTASGYAASLPVCGQTVSGTALRRALGLRSACFTIRYQDGSFLITTKGYGHGVGLSQWGAKALAEQGWTYEAILTHYFPGTQLCR